MPNISRSKDNLTMKLGQLIECNMRTIFLEKSYTKCDGETQTVFWKIDIEHISGFKVLYSLLDSKLRAIETSCD